MSTPVSLCAHAELNEAVLAELCRRLGKPRFNAWFQRGTSISMEEGRLKLAVAHPFAAGWIQDHFADELSAAAQAVVGHETPVHVCVDQALAGAVRKTQLDAQAAHVARTTSGKAGGDAPPVATPSRLRHRLETFVVGASNKLAYSAATSIIQSPRAEINPLFIHGPCGVGKTHLLQGLCNAVMQKPAGAHPRLAKYITAEQFTNEFVEAIRHKKVEDFRRLYRRLDLLAIDDVHFLAAKKATQEEFLHTFNTIHSAGKQVVLASDAHPRLVGQLMEQLVSRFLSGMVVKIEAPDRETRVKIMGVVATRLGMTIPSEVLEYVAVHIRGSVRELEGTLVKLSALANLAGQAITLDLAREALADYLAQTDSALTLGDIENVVAVFFGITPADIHSKRRTHTVSLARGITMYLARRHTRMSFPEIGQFLGKNHSSAVLAVQKLERWLQENAICRWSSPAGPKEMPIKGLLEMLTEQFA